jgi:cholesterol transport system auxiliary component
MWMPRHAVLALALALIPGCEALSALSDSSARMDAFTLSPLAAASAPTTGRRHLIVELPASAGALATDRILVKPLPFQAQYLPDGRWTEPAPALLQTLLVASFQNIGGFRLVGRTAAGLMPDYTLMTELLEFQAEPTAAEAAPLTIRITVNMTIIRESDRSIISARRFSATAEVATDETPDLVIGFNRAMQVILRDVVLWTISSVG